MELNIVEPQVQDRRLVLNVETFTKSAELFKDIESKLKLLIIGAGATGSHIAKAVAYSAPLFKEIRLIDGDVFQIHNVGNQSCSVTDDLGKNKALGVAEAIERHQAVKIDFDSVFVTDENMVELLQLDEDTVLVLAIDNIDVTKKILELCADMPVYCIVNTGLPLNVKYIAMAQGEVRLMITPEDIQEYLETVKDVNQGDIDERVMSELRACRTQQFYPVVLLVSAVANQVINTIAYFFNNPLEDGLELSKRYIISGAIPGIRTENTY